MELCVRRTVTEYRKANLSNLAKEAKCCNDQDHQVLQEINSIREVHKTIRANNNIITRRTKKKHEVCTNMQYVPDDGHDGNGAGRENAVSMGSAAVLAMGKQGKHHLLLRIAHTQDGD